MVDSSLSAPLQTGQTSSGLRLVEEVVGLSGSFLVVPKVVILLKKVKYEPRMTATMRPIPTEISVELVVQTLERYCCMNGL